MSHLTKKKLLEREKNNKLRATNGFNTGTRNMGFVSNNARKAASHLFLAKLELKKA